MTTNNTYRQLGNQIKDYVPPLQVTYHPDSDETDFSTQLFSLAKELIADAGTGIVLLPQGKGKDVPALPALTFQHPQRGKINYLAIPEGLEQIPFAEMVTFRQKKDDDSSHDLPQEWHTLASPVNLMVFISPSCPHCPQAVQAALTLAMSTEKVTVSILDVTHFSDMANEMHIKTVPMTIIDNELLINTVISVGKLAEKILTRGTAQYQEDLLNSLISVGNTDRAVNLLLQQKLEAKHFFSRWKTSTLSLRLGLMLVAEQVIDESVDVFASIIPGLCALLGTNDQTLKGDTIDLLGQIGDPRAFQPVQKCLSDQNPDIVEIAQEALENLTD